jgi:glucosamine-6-phosphate deaminase
MTAGLVESFRADLLNVHIYETRHQMGIASASAVAAEIRRLIAEQGRAIGIFASAALQNEFLDELVKAPEIEWTRVIGFQLDEYLGMDETAPQSFRGFLIDRLVRRVPMAEFHPLRGEAANPQAVCANYSALLESRPPDFAVLGIGENCHLSFIPAGDFNDPATVRVVELDEAIRRQQVHDGSFSSLDEAPRQAISLTIPVIMRCPRLFVIAPGIRKERAVRETIEGAITTACPASILRTHHSAHLFIDREAALSVVRVRSHED